MAPVGDAQAAPQPRAARPAPRQEGGAALLREVLRAERSRMARLVELFPWTPLGLALAAAAYAALQLLARARLDLVWLVVAYSVLALSALAPLAVLVAVLLVKLRRPPAHALDTCVLETGVPADTEFGLPLPRYLPLAQVRWDWVSPASSRVEQRREHGRLRERVELTTRGRYEQIERRVVIEDVFGLSRVALRVRAAQQVDVLPRLGGLRHLPSLHALASGDAVPHPMGLEDGDRLELRRYGNADPARYIHWKVLARTRKLMVRTPERALSVARRTAAFLCAGDGDDASAGAARLALERRLLGLDWVFGTDLEPGGVDRVDSALDALMRSSEVGTHGGEALSAFVQRVERKGPVSVVLFAPSRPGPWLERVLAVARRRRLHVVISIDALHGRQRPHPLRRLLTLPEPPPGTQIDDLEQVVRALAAAGAMVTVLDRESGRTLGEAHRRAMAAAGRARESEARA